MPTFKHPCPHCGKFIDWGVRSPARSADVTEPFAPAAARIAGAIVQPGWVACPKCGRSA